MTWRNPEIRGDDQTSEAAAVKSQLAMLPDGAVVLAWKSRCLIVERSP